MEDLTFKVIHFSLVLFLFLRFFFILERDRMSRGAERTKVDCAELGADAGSVPGPRDHDRGQDQELDGELTGPPGHLFLLDL